MSVNDSDETKERNRFTSAQIAPILAAAAILIAMAAIYIGFRQQANTSSSETGMGFITQQEARSILERAEDASNLAGNILNFLEVLLGIVGILGAILVWGIQRTLGNTEKELRDLEKGVRDQMANFEESFRQREQQLIQLEKSLQETVKGMSEDIGRNMAQAQSRVQEAFRVQRLQLLAEQQVRSRNYQAAIDALERALKLEDDNQATHYMLGSLYLANNIDMAVKHLQTAFDLEPDFTPGIAALGLALRRKGDRISDPAQEQERNRLWREAESKLREALVRDPRLTDTEAQSYYGSLGGLYRRKKEYYAALDAYQHAHKVTSDSTYPLINLASIHKLLGDDELATQYFEMVVNRAKLTLDDNPRDVWTRCDNAQALLLLGKSNEAMREIKLMLDQQPNPGILDTVLDGLRFLVNAPTPIPGLEKLIAELEAAKTELVAAVQSLRDPLEKP
jgi:tetratricopeptide (TPR) repeat protein